VQTRFDFINFVQILDKNGNPLSTDLECLFPIEKPVYKTNGIVVCLCDLNNEVIFPKSVFSVRMFKTNFYIIKFGLLQCTSIK
jgi:hypothetical protein